LELRDETWGRSFSGEAASSSFRQTLDEKSREMWMASANLPPENKSPQALLARTQEITRNFGRIRRSDVFACNPSVLFAGKGKDV
jgi:hypothetical protein